MLKNVRAASRKIPGTDETRTLMRYDTNACRVHRGAVPLFVTMSPDEKHNLIMLRLARTRRTDPILAADFLARRFGGIFVPELGNDYVQCGISLDELLKRVPRYDDRRSMIARDALASVDGCRLVMTLLLEYIFGLRICMACPDCTEIDSSKPCMDVLGSNARAEGGIFGRVDGVFISIEAQKSAGSLHFHAQVFVQGLHQHTPLREIYEIMRLDPTFTVEPYYRYVEHVTRQIYSDSVGWGSRREDRERSWPEYRDTFALVSTPAYLTARSGAVQPDKLARATSELLAEGQKWLH